MALLYDFAIESLHIEVDFLLYHLFDLLLLWIFWIGEGEGLYCGNGRKCIYPCFGRNEACEVGTRRFAYKAFLRCVQTHIAYSRFVFILDQIY